MAKLFGSSIYFRNLRISGRLSASSRSRQLSGTSTTQHRAKSGKDSVYCTFLHGIWQRLRLFSGNDPALSRPCTVSVYHHIRCASGLEHFCARTALTGWQRQRSAWRTRHAVVQFDFRYAAYAARSHSDMDSQSPPEMVRGACGLLCISFDRCDVFHCNGVQKLFCCISSGIAADANGLL